MNPTLDKISKAYFSENSFIAKEATNLYTKVYDLIKGLIVKGSLPDGAVLPATRLLASELQVSRSTIVRSYEFLRIEGYISSEVGSGHKVRPVKEAFKPKSQNTSYKYPDLSELGKSFSRNVKLLNSTDDKSVAFRPGLPPLDAFPVNKWKNLSNLYWKNINLSGLSYSPASGIEQLKRNIANYLNLTRNIQCEPNQVFIVSGSLQSLYLTGVCLLNKGDGVHVENPTFPNVQSIYKGLLANVQGIDVDEDGIKVAEMKQNSVLPKLIHVTPSCHYPSGSLMSIERRKELLSFAQSSGALIVENDYEHEITNSRVSLPSLFELDEQERTVYLGTFNRLLHPSLRIGYMVVPHFLIEPLEMLLKHSHRFVPPATQLVLNQFIEKKYLYQHINQVVSLSNSRRAIFKETFEELFQDTGFAISDRNQNSLQLLISLKNGNDREYVDRFAEHNLITHSYSKCFLNKKKEQGLIVGYSPMRIPVLKSNLRRMRQLV